jgi:hypothetical protein
LMDILQRHIQAYPDQAQYAWQIVLIEALRTMFPCKP